MRRTGRLILALVTFAGIQAVSVIALSAAWRARAEVPTDRTLFAFLGLHLVAILISCAAAAAVLLPGEAPPDRPAGGPPGLPPPFSPAMVPAGPRSPAPLQAHAVAAQTRAA